MKDSFIKTLETFQSRKGDFLYGQKEKTVVGLNTFSTLRIRAVPFNSKHFDRQLLIRLNLTH